MKGNPYNLIAFQSDSYTQTAQLSIEPVPDTLLRVFMAWKPLESAVDISTQNLTAPVRTQCCQLKLKKVLDKMVKMCSEAIDYKIIDCEGVL